MLKVIVSLAFLSLFSFVLAFVPTHTISLLNRFMFDPNLPYFPLRTLPPTLLYSPRETPNLTLFSSPLRYLPPTNLHPCETPSHRSHPFSYRTPNPNLTTLPYSPLLLLFSIVPCAISFMFCFESSVVFRTT